MVLLLEREVWDMLRFLAISTLVFVLSNNPVSAMAEDFVRVSTDTDGTEYLVDLESLAPIEESGQGNAVTVWIKIKRGPTDKGLWWNASGTQALSKNVYRCKDKTSAVEYQVIYDMRGAVTGEVGPRTVGKWSFKPIPPGTVEETIYDAVCNSKTRGELADANAAVEREAIALATFLATVGTDEIGHETNAEGKLVTVDVKTTFEVDSGKAISMFETYEKVICGIDPAFQRLMELGLVVEVRISLTPSGEKTKRITRC